MNPVATTINLGKNIGRVRVSNLQPPVLKSCTLLTELGELGTHGDALNLLWPQYASNYLEVILSEEIKW